MKSNTTVAYLLGAVCLLQAGALTFTWLTGSAQADDPSLLASLEIPSEKVMCRLFKVEADQPQFTLPDGRTEAGQWALENRVGWRVKDVDFEMSTKSNGFPQGWLQVCLSER